MHRKIESLLLSIIITGIHESRFHEEDESSINDLLLLCVKETEDKHLLHEGVYGLATEGFGAVSARRFNETS
jgi:hypothetical protein